ncbi:MAG: hypothetical protein WC916_03420 [Candidatus Woesearchaeota archaeon]
MNTLEKILIIPIIATTFTASQIYAQNKTKPDDAKSQKIDKFFDCDSTKGREFILAEDGNVIPGKVVGINALEEIPCGTDTKFTYGGSTSTRLLNKKQINSLYKNPCLTKADMRILNQIDAHNAIYVDKVSQSFFNAMHTAIRDNIFTKKEKEDISKLMKEYDVHAVKMMVMNGNGSENVPSGKVFYGGCEPEKKDTSQTRDTTNTAAIQQNNTTNFYFFFEDNNRQEGCENDSTAHEKKYSRNSAFGVEVGGQQSQYLGKWIPRAGLVAFNIAKGIDASINGAHGKTTNSLSDVYKSENGVTTIRGAEEKVQTYLGLTIDAEITRGFHLGLSGGYNWENTQQNVTGGKEDLFINGVLIKSRAILPQETECSNNHASAGVYAKGKIGNVSIYAGPLFAKNQRPEWHAGVQIPIYTTRGSPYTPRRHTQ